MDSLLASSNRHRQLNQFRQLHPLSWEELAIQTLSMCITELGAALSVSAGVVGFAGGTEISQIALGGNRVDFSLQVCSVIMEAVDVAYLIIISIRFRWVIIPRSSETVNESAMLLLRFYLAAIAVFETLETLNGFGRPDDGNEFKEASARFNVDIYNFLFRAFSERVSGWSGEAGDGYSRKVQSVLLSHQSLMQADREVAHVVSIQARQVESLRIVSKECKIQFSSLSSVAAMAITPGFSGSPMALFSFAVVLMTISLLITLPLIVGCIGNLIHQGGVNAGHLRKALDGYRHVVDDVKSITSPSTVVSSPSPVSAFTGARFSSPVGEQLKKLRSLNEPGGYASQARPARAATKRDVAFAAANPVPDVGNAPAPAVVPGQARGLA